MTCVFVSFWLPYFCPSEGHKHGISIQSLINLSRTFLRIPPTRNIAHTWIFARLFEYLSSFTSLILDFTFWMVLMMVGQWKPAIKEGNNKLRICFNPLTIPRLILNHINSKKVNKLRLILNHVKSHGKEWRKYILKFLENDTNPFL